MRRHEPSQEIGTKRDCPDSCAGNSSRETESTSTQPRAPRGHGASHARGGGCDVGDRSGTEAAESLEHLDAPGIARRGFDRRAFLQRTALTGVAAGSVGTLLSACGSSASSSQRAGPRACSGRTRTTNSWSSTTSRRTRSSSPRSTGSRTPANCWAAATSGRARKAKTSTRWSTPSTPPSHRAPTGSRCR